MKFLFPLLLVAVCAVTAWASPGDHRVWLQDGSPVADSDARKSVNGFGASMIVTTDPDWEGKWNTPAEVTPTFSAVHDLKRGEQATILVFFANPALDAAGTADVTCDVRVIRPDRQVVEDRGMSALAGPLSGPPTNTFLAENVIRFTGEPEDPLGEWVVEVVVHDNHRRVAVPLRTTFTLSAAPVAAAPPLSEKALDEWLTYYYLHPEPEKTPLAILSMQRLGYLKKDSARAPLVAFLSLIFRSSGAVIEPSLKPFPSLSTGEQQVLLHALWVAGTGEAKAHLKRCLALLADRGIAGNEELSKLDPPALDRMTIDSPAVLDMLWGAFMATGDEKYVIRVIGVLPYAAAEGNVAQLLIGSSARWSLAANAARHRRVLDICVSQMAKQPEEVRKVLAEVIVEATRKPPTEDI